MGAKVAALVARLPPIFRRIAKTSNRSLAGRGAVLTVVFGLFVVSAVWFGADPLPRSAWHDLGLAADSLALRRVYAREVEALDLLFAENDFHLSALRGGDDVGVPRLAVVALPLDMAESEDSEARKALFLRALLPLVLQANADLQRARARIIAALDAQAAGRLGATDALWLDEVARWYGAEAGNAVDLLSRIDTVPPSLALAQAAQESGWGTSRFALRANALFGQRSWGASANGLTPTEAERNDFKVRRFPDLMSAVRSYLHNLNSHRAYQDFRTRRARARALGMPVHALDLVRGLKSYSEEGAAYVAALGDLIDSNDLLPLDRATLRAGR